VNPIQPTGAASDSRVPANGGSLESPLPPSEVAPPEGPGTRWELIESLFHDALQKEEAERTAFLDCACPDAEARREVEGLLLAHASIGKVDRLAEKVMSPLINPAGDTPREPPPDADIPSFPGLDRYRVIEKLGKGGMGVVYKARDERLDRDVALKFLPAHLSGEEAAKKRFMVEARAAASLEHPNICTVHEIGETTDGQLYIVMGYYDGEPLDRHIAAGPMSVREALRIAVDVAAGLAKAHDRGIVHRDIKPANIMVGADGVVKILDFGIAKLTDVTATQTVGIVGTLAYMSPEQAFGEQVDARTDVWSLGVVLHEMLSGHRPFRGPGEQAVLYAILTGELEPISSWRPELPDGLEAVLRNAMAKKPRDRYASARELGSALAAIAAQLSDSSAVSLERRTVPATPATSQTASRLTGAGERRYATVLAIRVGGCDDLIERMGPEEVDDVISRIRDIAAEVATRHGGLVNHFAAEEAVILFGVASMYEDDYLRAIRAALELNDRVRELVSGTPALRSLGLHSGVHTGPLVAQRQRSGDRRFRLAGAPLDVASRLAAIAERDAILVSPEAFRLAAPFIDAEPSTPVMLQPNAPMVTPHRVTGQAAVNTRLEAAERAVLTPYAGRTRELNALRDQLQGAIEGVGGLAVVIGEPGLGKTRLLHELRRSVEDERSLLVMGRCDAYGGTTPYMPFVQALRELLFPGITPGEPLPDAQVEVRLSEIDPSLVESIAVYCTLLSIPSTRFALPRHLQGEHLQAAMLDALAALVIHHATKVPTVLLLEDWHWADEASRAALDRLADVAPDYPLMIVVTSRPDADLNWSSGEQRTVMHLGPLSPDASMEIMQAVLGASTIDPELVRQLHERTGGNPFFLEETCHALSEQHAVGVNKGEAVIADPGALTRLPDTVQAVIGTRLDRLPPESRDALRIAAVIGREFPRGILEELAGTDLDVARQLEPLRRAGLIQQTSIAAEPTYRFKHVLTQEVAYDTLLEHQKRVLHSRAAAAIERRYSDRLDEQRERLAHHYSRAEEWKPAIENAILAADRATAISQFVDALATLDQAGPWIEKLDDEAIRNSLRVEALLRKERLCETLGHRTRQIALIEELIDLLAPAGRSPKLAEAYLRQGDVFTLMKHFDSADRALETSLRLSRELGDRGGERNVLRSLGLLRSYEGRYDLAVTNFEGALSLDLELGETPAAAGDVASLGNILRKMGRQKDALEALQEALEYISVDEDPTKWCTVMSVIAAAHRDLGNDDTALEHMLKVRDVAAERRLPVLASFSLPGIAHLQLQRGDVEGALQTYRQAVDLSRRARHAEGLAQSLRVLGDVLFGLQRYDEALSVMMEAEEVVAQLEDQEGQAVLWQRLAQASERSGHPSEAERYWELLRQRCEEAGDASGEALALEGIARSARQRGTIDVAIRHYERAVGRAVAGSDLEREVTLRNTLGLLRWEEGNYQEALRQYEAALRLCREQEDRVHEGLILNSLGATLLKLRRYDEARTALEEGARVNGNTGQLRLEAHSYSVLGDVLMESGRPAEARVFFERSLSLRPMIVDRRGEGWMFQRLGRALEAEGRPEDAQTAYDAARSVAREVGDAELVSTLDPRPRSNPDTPIEES
jgi:tetratricopeptide (TPR) repeat protein/class 3 adenylate cyclase/tRNA A-37 threonylcarbamoyl transferase component Bud32